MNETSIAKAKEWLDPFFDQETRKIVDTWLTENSDEIEESFYKDLEFGTGGMRGIMGVGTNRINKYTIGKATLGLAKYLKKSIQNKPASVAIAYDSRNRSKEFAFLSAKVLSAQGIKSYVFEELRPTPLLSFAVRELNCDAGIVITASHNPKEYNGYKVYWNDGGQLVAPQDKGVMQSVKDIQSFSEIDFNGNDELIFSVDEKVELKYRSLVKELLPNNKRMDKSIGIVFTSIHGTGITMVPKVLEDLGFNQVYYVEDQSIPNGDFPTVESPNPEERSALAMAIDLAKEKDAELVLGTDPDTDRVGLAIKNNEGEWILLNGNQAGSILVHYLLDNLDAASQSTSFVCKTIVTSNLISDIANDYNVECINTLTGFKYIAQTIAELEGKKKFIGGGEESFGYLAGDFVRDKDAVISVALFAQIAALCKGQGKSMYHYLLDIYSKHGIYKERLLSITKKGKAGLEDIQHTIENYRSNKPSVLAGEKVKWFADYSTGIKYFTADASEEKLPFDSSNVLQFATESGSLITVRPSGTEPKIKYYFSVNEEAGNSIEESLDKAEKHLDQLEKAFV